MIEVSKISNIKKWLMVLILVFYGRNVMLVPYMKDVYYDQLILALNISNQQLGILTSAVGITSIFGYLFGGIIADKVSTKKVMIISGFSAGLVTLWYATLPKSFLALLIIHSLMAIDGTLLFWAAYVRVLRLLGGKDGQGTYYGIAEGLRGLIGIICPMIVAGLMSRYVNATSGLRAALLFYSATFFITGILSIFFIVDIKDESTNEEQENHKMNLKEYISMFKKPGVWAVSLLVFGTYLVYCLQSYTTPYLTGVCGVSSELVATIASIRQYGIGVLAMPIFGILADKILKSTAKTSFIGSILLIPTILVLLFISGESLLLIVAVVLLLGFFVNGIRGIYYATQDEAKVPIEAAGAAAGVISTIGFSPDAFVFIQVGAWLDKYPIEQAYKMIWIYMLVGALIAIMASIWILILSKQKKNV